MSNYTSLKRKYNLYSFFYKQIHFLQTVGKDRKYRKLVAENIPEHRKLKILDIGTGVGLSTVEINKKICDSEIVGIDISYKMLKYARGRKYEFLKNKNIFYLINGNAECFPFFDNSFDVITSVFGFGGIKDKEKAFEEIIRVAKNGAYLLIAEMDSPSKKNRLRHNIHKFFILPWVKLVWEFEDAQIFRLANEYEKWIDVLRTEYKRDSYVENMLFFVAKVTK